MFTGKQLEITNIKLLKGYFTKTMTKLNTFVYHFKTSLVFPCYRTNENFVETRAVPDMSRATYTPRPTRPPPKSVSSHDK